MLVPESVFSTANSSKRHSFRAVSFLSAGRPTCVSPTTARVGPGRAWLSIAPASNPRYNQPHRVPQPAPRLPLGECGVFVCLVPAGGLVAGYRNWLQRKRYYAQCVGSLDGPFGLAPEPGWKGTFGMESAGDAGGGISLLTFSPSVDSGAACWSAGVVEKRSRAKVRCLWSGSRRSPRLELSSDSVFLKTSSPDERTGKV